MAYDEKKVKIVARTEEKVGFGGRVWNGIKGTLWRGTVDGVTGAAIGAGVGAASGALAGAETVQNFVKTTAAGVTGVPAIQAMQAVPTVDMLASAKLGAMSGAALFGSVNAVTGAVKGGLGGLATGTKSTEEKVGETVWTKQINDERLAQLTKGPQERDR